EHRVRPRGRAGTGVPRPSSERAPPRPRAGVPGARRTVGALGVGGRRQRRHLAGPGPARGRRRRRPGGRPRGWSRVRSSPGL
ncbi:MAG: hypothetical protein AVDCRST_MAG36-1055, partial [uncultured Nocardioidaceae bacterium]